MTSKKSNFTILDMTPSEQGYRTVVESNGRLAVSYLRPNYGRKVFESQLRASLMPQEYDLLENSGRIVEVLDRFEKDNRYFEKSGQAVLKQLVSYGKALYVQDQDLKSDGLADEILHNIETQSDNDLDATDLAVFTLPQQSNLIEFDKQMHVDWSDYDFDNLGVNRVTDDNKTMTLHNAAMRLRKSSYDKGMLGQLASGNITSLDRGSYVNYTSLGDRLSSNIHPNVLQNLQEYDGLSWSPLDVDKDAIESALLTDVYEIPDDGTASSLVTLYRQPSAELGSVQDISDDIDEYARLQHKGRRQVLNQLLVANPASMNQADLYQIDPKYAEYVKTQSQTRQPTGVTFENIKLAKHDGQLVPDVANSVVSKQVLGMPNYRRGNRSHQEAVASTTVESMLQSTSLFSIIAKDMKETSEKDMQRKKALRQARAKQHLPKGPELG